MLDHSHVIIGDSTLRRTPVHKLQKRPQNAPSRYSTKTPGLEKYWYFSRADFRCDEWLCRICNRFSSTRIPVLFLKREAIEHERTSEHQHCVEQFYKFLEDYPQLLEQNRQCEMGWGPGQGDPLFPDQVYDQLTWNTPDARKGVDFVNQFVTFWADDVAAALEESESGEIEEHVGSPVDKGRGSRPSAKGKQTSKATIQKRRTRPTFEEFLESIEIVQDTWGSPFENVYGDDGWGVAAMPVVPEAEPEAEGAPQHESVEGDGWVVQKGRERSKPSRGRVRGRGRPRRASGKLGQDEGRKPKDTQPVIQNLFTQLHVHDVEGV